MRRAERGFTLLEVLAAVALLGIVYVTLAGVAIQGLRAEGESRHRLEASLIADETLAALETQMATGVPLEAGTTTEELDDYEVVTTIAPFSHPALNAARAAIETSVPSLFGTGSANSPNLVQSVLVSVRWAEAGRPASLQRLTYGFDATGVSERAGGAQVITTGGAE